MLHEAKGEYLLNRITEDHNNDKMVKLHSHYIKLKLYSSSCLLIGPT